MNKSTSSRLTHWTLHRNQIKEALKQSEIRPDRTNYITSRHVSMTAPVLESTWITKWSSWNNHTEESLKQNPILTSSSSHLYIVTKSCHGNRLHPWWRLRVSRRKNLQQEWQTWSIVLFYLGWVCCGLALKRCLHSQQMMDKWPDLSDEQSHFRDREYSTENVWIFRIFNTVMILF